jgi:hypothetical protein
MKNLKVHLIVEILGRPADNVTEALQTITTRIGSEDGVEILSKNYNDPRPIENSDLFTAFVDIEAELKNLDTYFQITFTYLPAHIEIVYPEKIDFSNNDFNLWGNKIIQKLHEYDAVAKRLVVERDSAIKKLQELHPELFKDVTPKNTLEKLTQKNSKKKKPRKKSRAK